MTDINIIQTVKLPDFGLKEESLSDDHFDVLQEVSNAGFGDMLHDKERNAKYYKAIQKAIAEMHLRGKQVHVLDIGTGTGLLSMMAVVSGADSVTACEAFLPMANCAEKIFKANGMIEKVKLVKKRSTELTVGEGCDMPHKANLLVAELLDTELIGEAAISIYNHAHKELLTDDVVCIPSSAVCFAQVVDCSLAAQWNTFKTLTNLDAEILISPPKSMNNCRMNNKLHDVQLSQLDQKYFKPLTQALQIFKFNFMEPMQTSRHHNLTVETIRGGCANLVFFWWDIKLDVDGDILLSCAPYWEHPECPNESLESRINKHLWRKIPWRDHWMQAIYYIPKPVHFQSEKKPLTLSCNHDEFSFWFDIFSDQQKATEIPKHFCTCSLHQAFSRSRIGQINDSLRNKAYMRFLEDTIHSKSKVLVLSDGSVIGLATRKLGAESVILLESNFLARRFMETLVEHNKIDNVRFIKTLDELEEKTLSEITHVFGEPYFINSILPWGNFEFGFMVANLLPKLSSNVVITPLKARILAVPVEFTDLHKISQPLGTCEGFDVSLFDEMLLEAKKLTQSNVESFPLWEYPCKALANPKFIFQCKFHDFLKNSSTCGKATIEVDGVCNGVALWVIYYLDDEDKGLNTGITEPIEPGEFIKWNMFHQQGVSLMGSGKAVLSGKHCLSYEVDFKPAEK